LGWAEKAGMHSVRVFIFHDYGRPQAKQLARWVAERPALYTECIARGRGARFDCVLPAFAEKYANFELLIDWKIAKGGNSGIMYRVSEDTPSPYWTGPEYQLLDDAAERLPWSSDTATGSAYAIYPPTKDACKPVGQWNTAKIVCNGEHVEHWLNGRQIVSYEFQSADWNRRVQKSKFKAWPKYGKNPSGYIDLQDHGGRVEFRNIKIHVLP